ncbi:MAG: hypothetical protein AAF409_21790 [Pseudomonadota bacterium]
MTSSQPRTLADFGTLTAAEQKVLDELDTGEIIILGVDVPDETAGEDRLIRARFLRWVILTNGEPVSDETWPKPRTYRLHEKGVQVTGALITGEGEYRNAHAALDLQGAEVAYDALLTDCLFTAKPNLLGARMQGVILNRSRLPGLRADGLQTRGDLFMRGIESAGEVRLLGAQIGGDLDFTGSTLRNANHRAFSADLALIAGSLFLHNASTAGEVSLLGAKIGGDLECGGAKLANESGKALNADGALITGTFFWRPDGEGNQPSTCGEIDLTGADIGRMSDDPACWPRKGDLLLNRCRYGAFTGKGTKGAERIDWLSRHRHFFGRFEPQPYEHCAKVLREMGHQEDARKVLIEKERLQHAARRKEQGDGPSRLAIWLWDTFLRITVAYGHKPFIAVWWLLAFWVAGQMAYHSAWSADAFKPNNPFILRSAEWVRCGAEIADTVALAVPGDNSAPQAVVRGLRAEGQTRQDCFMALAEGESFPSFHAGIYSLDVLFPLVEVEQQANWIPDEDRPVGAIAKVMMYVQIIAGWALSLLAVAGLSGIIKSD